MVRVKPEGIPLNEFRDLSESNQNKLRNLSKTMQQRWKVLDSIQRDRLLSGVKPDVINDNVWSTLSKSNKEALTAMNDYDIQLLRRKLARAYSQPIGGGVMPPRVFTRFNENGIPLAPLDTRRNIVKRMVYTLQFQPEMGNQGAKKRGSAVPRKASSKRPNPKVLKRKLPKQKLSGSPRHNPDTGGTSAPPPSKKRKERAPLENSNVIGMLPEGHKLQLARAITKVVAKSQQNILKMFDRFDISMLPIGVYNKGGGAIQVRPRYRTKEDQDAWYRKHFGP